MVGTHRIATMHIRLAKQAARSLPVTIRAMPVEMPKMEQCVQWHKHRTSDQGHRVGAHASERSGSHDGQRVGNRSMNAIANRKRATSAKLDVQPVADALSIIDGGRCSCA